LKEALDSTNQDFDQPRKLMLDVITNDRKSAGLRPVLIHVHGGAWRAGKKDIFYPYEKLLVSEDDWVKHELYLCMLVFILIFSW
jgi:acetyl esterase/lipase